MVRQQPYATLVGWCGRAGESTRQTRACACASGTSGVWLPLWISMVCTTRSSTRLNRSHPPAWPKAAVVLVGFACWLSCWYALTWGWWCTARGTGRAGPRGCSRRSLRRAEIEVVLSGGCPVLLVDFVVPFVRRSTARHRVCQVHWKPCPTPCCKTRISASLPLSFRGYSSTPGTGLALTMKPGPLQLRV